MYRNAIMHQWDKLQPGNTNRRTAGIKLQYINSNTINHHIFSKTIF